MRPKLTIQIVGRNGAAHLRRACKALQRIPEGEVIVRYIDNGSTDDSVRVVRGALPAADVMERGRNTGYAGAHNFGFSLCETEYLMVHDQDVVIDWEKVKKLLKMFDEDERLGAMQGKLLRADGKIDSAGIVRTLALNGIDRGANEEDQGQFEEHAALLATAGACSIYRMTALGNVAHSEVEVWDDNFFAYKEDVDLGWRLNNAGWKVMYEPVLTGTHHRTLGKRGVMGWGVRPRAVFARLRSPRTRYSLRNYCWMIAKNASLKTLLLHGIFIDARLLVFFMFGLIYPPLFSVWGEIWRGLPKMLRKRG